MSALDLDAFLRDGFVRLDAAFPRALADEARALLWRDTGCDPDDPRTWRAPVVRLGMYPRPPFVAAASTPALRDAFDALVGPGRWLPCGSMGTFVVRFPSDHAPDDTGWHVDPSFGYEDPDFLRWRVNVTSRGRALLMLFLFSDVDEHSAPTRIRVGSHLPIARLLAPAGDAGLTLGEIVGRGLEETESCAEALAVGEAGTVYLCHPFLVHAAQSMPPRSGVEPGRPRFLAQPPLLPRAPLSIEGPSLVEAAIRHALRE